jgi:hypothetical protein
MHIHHSPDGESRVSCQSKARSSWYAFLVIYGRHSRCEKPASGPIVLATMQASQRWQSTSNDDRKRTAIARASTIRKPTLIPNRRPDVFPSAQKSEISCTLTGDKELRERTIGAPRYVAGAYETRHQWRDIASWSPSRAVTRGLPSCRPAHESNSTLAANRARNLATGSPGAVPPKASSP